MVLHQKNKVTKFVLSKPKKKPYCTIPSGDETSFEKKGRQKIYSNNIQGSNCYSYAFDHPALNGQRPHKSVPGLIYETMNPGVKLKSTNWNKCEQHVKDRVILDGKTMSKLMNWSSPSVKYAKGTTQMEKITSKSPPLYRKVVMVVAPSKNGNVSTDFHFYRMDKIPVEQIYNQPLHIYKNNRKSVYENEYIKLGVNAFLSNYRLEHGPIQGTEALMHKAHIVNTSSNPIKRALINLKIHAKTFPSYAHTFIPNPFWILDIQNSDIHSPNIINIIEKRYTDILKKLDGVHNNGSKHDQYKILRAARKQALEGKCMNKTDFIGLWSHKLGWGTDPLNTDGDGRYIVNPKLAKKYHGSYDYNIVCGVFEVMNGHGATSSWEKSMIEYIRNKIKRFKNV